MALKQATSTVPIVFASVTEPVAQGIVEILAHPGGNLTGFSFLEPTIGAKWLNLLMQMAPNLKHIAFMFNPASGPYSKLFFQSIETATSRFAVQAVMAPVHDVNEGGIRCGCGNYYVADPAAHAGLGGRKGRHCPKKHNRHWVSGIIIDTDHKTGPKTRPKNLNVINLRCSQCRPVPSLDQHRFTRSKPSARSTVGD
jgi:hypothetical protein